MSLLDDVSIVVTPNGYKAGELYAVVPVHTEGAEEITNGDFATDSDWNTSATGISIAGGKLSRDATATASIFQSSSVITPSVLYEITFEIVDYTSGTLTPRFGWNGTGGTAVSGVGTYTQTIIKVNQNVIELYGTAFVGSIDNVSVKELTSADMDVTRATAATRVDENGLVNYAEVLGDEEITNGDFSNGLTGWGTQIPSGQTVEVISNQLHINYDSTETQGSTGVSQNILVSGKRYITTIDVASVTGTFKAQVGNVSHNITTSGIKTFTNVASNPYLYVVRQSNSNSFEATINSVSIKEVTRNNVPRIDYTGGGCPHILAEPQRTNLVTYSEDFSNASWVTVSGSVTKSYNTTTSPSGLEDADSILATSAGSIVWATYQPLTADYTGTLYLKRKTGSGDIQFTASGTFSTVDLSSGDWVRVEHTYSATAGTKAIGIKIVDSGDEVYIWGAQLEVGSYATSYIPTSGSTVTRNQDQFTRDGIGSLINDSEGVLFVEMALLIDDGTFKYITLTDVSGANKVQIDFDYSSSRLQYLVASGGLAQCNIKIPYSGTNMDKIAVKWKENDFAVWINGVEIGSDTSGLAPIGLNTLKFSAPTGSNNFAGKVKQLQVYNTALTDTQLAALTS